MKAMRFSRRLLLLGAVPAACGFAQSPRRSVAALAELQRIVGEDGGEVTVTAADTGGTFRWEGRSIDDPDGGTVLAGPGPRGRWVRQFTGPINARWFGASPGASARENSRAFAAASGAINRAGGGTLLVPPGTYRVGHQQIAGRRGLGRAVLVADIIKIERCRGPVTISGTGAVLKAADGLRYGAFDPVTGRTHQAKLPFTDTDFRADAYTMIAVRHCSGPVRIEGFELDGNQRTYQLGGEWGDVGRQVSAIGIVIDGNTGGVTIERVNSRDHGQDGIMAVHHGLTNRSPRYPVMLTDVVCDRNGRQGLSWVGGTQLTAIRCKFNRTGRGRVASPPGAGVDIEAEGSVCRNGRFVECEFSDNSGNGLVADTGDSADVSFERCRFIGTTTWSAWPAKPRFSFRDCLFVGSIVRVFPHADPKQATQFIGCRFDDDPQLSPTRQVFGDSLGDLGGGSTNVLFSGCTFTARAPHRSLPWSPPDTRYHNCRFRQAGAATSSTRGVFTGTCDFQTGGQVNFEGSRFAGRVTHNGRQLS
jgi:hypothetical protein